MKPTSITISAFGPYASVQNLDMAALGDTGLYAICGETGAGKTTLFDAIMYALYGRGSGPDRDGKNLRSVYADPGVETYVEMTFQAGGKTFWIRRSPAQRRPGNKTDTPARVALRQMPEGKPITGEAEVKRRVEEDIIGVDAAQFSQIAMIAQGEFRKFLQAKSKDRTEILRRIFKTDGFKRVADLMMEATGEKHGQYIDARKEMLTALKSLTLLEDSPLLEELTDLRATSPEGLNPEKSLNIMEEILRMDEDQEQRDAAERDEAEKRRDAARKAFEEGAGIQKKRDDLSNLQKEAQRAREEVAKQEGRKKLADQALVEVQKLGEEITTLKNQLKEYDALSLLEGESKAAEEAARAAGAIARQAGETLAALSKEKQRLTAEGETLRDAGERRAAALIRLKEAEGALDQLRALETRLNHCEQAEERLNAADEKARGAKSREQEAQRRLSALSGELEELGNTALWLSNLHQQEAEREKNQKELTELMALLGRWQEASQQYQQALESYQNSKMSATLAREKATRLRNRYNDNIAGVLAANLREDTPCPVCGSPHHPRPAAAAAAVTLDSVNRLDKEATLAEELAGQQAADCQGQKAASEELNRQLDGKMPGIPPRERQPFLEEAFTANLRHQNTLELALQEAEVADQRAKQLREEAIPQANQEKETATREQGEAEKQLSAARQALIAARAEVDNAAAGLLAGASENGTASENPEGLPENSGAGPQGWNHAAPGQENGAVAPVHPSAGQPQEKTARLDAAAREAWLKAWIDETARLNQENQENQQETAQGPHQENHSAGQAQEKIARLDAAARYQWEVEIKTFVDEKIRVNQENQKAAEQQAAKAERDQARMKEITERLSGLEEELTRQTALESDSRAKAAREGERLKGLQKQLGDKRATLPFPDKAGAEEEIARKTRKQEQLNRAIADAEKRLREAQTQLAEKSGGVQELQRQLAGAPEVNLPELEQEKNNAQRHLDLAQKKERQTDTRLKMNRLQGQTLRQKSTDAAALEKEYRMMQDLTSMVTGKLSGYKVSLEAYVQMAFFDQILGYANQRFLRMSQGQYELKRRAVADSGNQGQTGLDLDVRDHQNGKTRGVDTLSGGESFLAALALALGMSDTIQAASASAVHLDTMFVDEGFGSLSENFRQLAMEELMNTASSGHRLIGIISHVEDIKAQLPHGIEVTKQGVGGSVAKIR